MIAAEHGHQRGRASRNFQAIRRNALLRITNYNSRIPTRLPLPRVLHREFAVEYLLALCFFDCLKDEQMPYGIPWDYPSTILYFQCPKCYRAIDQEYRPYCSNCGMQQPPEPELEAGGRIIRKNHKLAVRRISDLAEMNSFLIETKGRPVGLWSYCVSHSELEIRLCHSGGPNLSGEWLNTAIYCSGAEVVRFDSLRWDANISLRTTPSGYSREDIILEDADAGVHVRCGAVKLYVGVEPGI